MSRSSVTPRPRGQICQHFMDKLQEIYKAQELCDLVFQLRSQKLNAHRVVLSAWSRALHTQLAGTGSTALVQVEYDNLDVFRSFLHFLYSGQINDVAKSNLIQVLHLATSLQVQELREVCEEALKGKVHIANIISTYHVARKFKLPNLEEFVTDYLQMNLPEAVKQADFLGLSPARFNGFLSSGWVCIMKPEVKLFLIISWLGYDVRQRQQYLVLLLRYIDWSAVANDFLNEICQTENFFTTHQSSLYLLLQTLFSAGIPLGPYADRFPALRKKYAYLLDHIVQHSYVLPLESEEYFPVTFFLVEDSAKESSVVAGSCSGSVEKLNGRDLSNDGVTAGIGTCSASLTEAHVHPNAVLAVSESSEKTRKQKSRLNASEKANGVESESSSVLNPDECVIRKNVKKKGNRLKVSLFKGDVFSRKTRSAKKNQPESISEVSPDLVNDIPKSDCLAKFSKKETRSKRGKNKELLQVKVSKREKSMAAKSLKNNSVLADDESCDKGNIEQNQAGEFVEKEIHSDEKERLALTRQQRQTATVRSPQKRNRISLPQKTNEEDGSVVKTDSLTKNADHKEGKDGADNLSDEGEGDKEADPDYTLPSERKSRSTRMRRQAAVTENSKQASREKSNSDKTSVQESSEKKPKLLPSPTKKRKGRAVKVEPDDKYENTELHDSEIDSRILVKPEQNDKVQSNARTAPKRKQADPELETDKKTTPQNESEHETQESNNKQDDPDLSLNFRCEDCHYTAPTQRRLTNHMERVHGNRATIFACSICTFECSWNKRFYEHMKTHFPGPPYACNFGGCRVQSDRIQNLLIHRRSHTDERPHKCQHCSACFKTRNNLVAHLKCHSEDKAHECPECGRRFKMKNTLEQHLVTHGSLRPYLCEQCGFSTKFQSHLISHKRIHTGQVFQCSFPMCSYSSPKRSQLKAHMRSHLNVRHHACPQCSKTFVEKSHLVRHLKIHQGVRPHKCDQCDYSSTRVDKVNEHRRKYHSQESSAAAATKKPYKYTPRCKRGEATKRPPKKRRVEQPPLPSSLTPVMSAPGRPIRPKQDKLSNMQSVIATLVSAAEELDLASPDPVGLQLEVGSRSEVRSQRSQLGVGSQGSHPGVAGHTQPGVGSQLEVRTPLEVGSRVGSNVKVGSQPEVRSQPKVSFLPPVQINNSVPPPPPPASHSRALAPNSAATGHGDLQINVSFQGVRVPVKDDTWAELAAAQGLISGAPRQGTNLNSLLYRSASQLPGGNTPTTGNLGQEGNPCDRNEDAHALLELGYSGAQKMTVESGFVGQQTAASASHPSSSAALLQQLAMSVMGPGHLTLGDPNLCSPLLFHSSGGPMTGGSTFQHVAATTTHSEAAVIAADSLAAMSNAAMWPEAGMRTQEGFPTNEDLTVRSQQQASHSLSYPQSREEDYNGLNAFLPLV